MANRAFMNFGRSYENLTMPVKVSMKFTVARSDSGGLGITSLKSNGYVNHVYMHTSSTPAGGNPNPADGNIMIQLKDNYATLVGSAIRIQAPPTGGALSTKIADTALTVGAMYQINALGTSTAADWLALGLPAGVTAAVGQTFCALVQGVGTHTGTVKALGSAGVETIEQIGSMANPSGVNNIGAWINFQCLKTSSALTMASYTPAGVITNGTPDTFAGTPAVLTGTIANTAALATPTDGSIIEITLFLDNSSVNVDGL